MTERVQRMQRRKSYRCKLCDWPLYAGIHMFGKECSVIEKNVAEADAQ